MSKFMKMYIGVSTEGIALLGPGCSRKRFESYSL